MPETQNIEYESVWKNEFSILVTINRENIKLENEQ